MAASIKNVLPRSLQSGLNNSYAGEAMAYLRNQNAGTSALGALRKQKRASQNIIPSDKASIYTALSTLQRQALVLPQNAPLSGVAGFIFRIPKDAIAQLKSTITDHYCEDNTAINDHIALHPETFTLRGLEAELTAENLGGAESTMQFGVEALPMLATTYLPALPPGGKEVLDYFLSANEPRNESVISDNPEMGSAHAYYLKKAGDDPGLTHQQKVFGYFFQLWRGRMLFSIETPWGIMQSMAIESIRFTQSEESEGSSELEVQFKKYRIAGDLLTVTPGTLAGRCANQYTEAAPVRLGPVGKTPVATDKGQKVIGKFIMRTRL